MVRMPRTLLTPVTQDDPKVRRINIVSLLHPPAPMMSLPSAVVEVNGTVSITLKMEASMASDRTCKATAALNSASGQVRHS
jgi:hypothetical protein